MTENLPDLTQVKRYLSFAWTVPAIMERRKDTTRRTWDPATARLFPRGTWFWGTDRALYRNGRRICLGRISTDPFVQNTRDMDPDEFNREGFDYLESIGATVGDCGPRELWRRWTEDPRELVVVRFEVVAFMSELPEVPKLQGELAL